MTLSTVPLGRLNKRFVSPSVSSARVRDRLNGQLARLAFLITAAVFYVTPASAQSQCSAPSRRLTRTDYALLATSTTLLVADGLLSINAARRGGPHQESNVLLGPHPSVGRHNTYSALTLIANLSVARIANPSLRRTVWVAVSAVEARTVLHMFAVGYRLDFRL
jgi:hypothetical protein